MSGIFGEEGQFQLAEVYHRGIWSIHLSGPSGKESHVGFSAKFVSLSKSGFGVEESEMRHLWKVFADNRGFMGCENPPWAKPFLE